MAKTVHDGRQIDFLAALLATVPGHEFDDPEELEERLSEEFDRRIKITDGPDWVPNNGVWSEDEILDLMERILQDSLYSLVDTKAKRETQEEALEWLLETEAEDELGNPWPFSFENITGCLGYDTEELREQFLNEGRRLGLIRL